MYANQFLAVFATEEMMMLRGACMVGLVFMTAVSAEARDLRIATWNAGWHLSKAEAVDWIAKCSQPFALNAAGTAFEPAATGKPGWELDWDRNAAIKPKWDFNVLPPCSVYQDRDRNTVPVTAAAYDKRVAQMATFIADKPSKR